MSVRPPLTHFLCVPLINAASRPRFEASLRKFNEDLSAYPATAQLANSQVVRPVGSLHLTLGVMSLASPGRVRAAMEFLSSLDIEGIIRDVTSTLDRPQTTQCNRDLCIRMSIQGLEARPPANRTSVLWVPISHPLLMQVCLRLRKLFQDAGYMMAETRPLKLHATVLNTIYSKGRQHNNGRARLCIDARNIVQDMGDRMWAEHITLDRVALCEMGTQPVKDRNGRAIDEAYKEVAAKRLPT